MPVVGSVFNRTEHQGYLLEVKAAGMTSLPLHVPIVQKFLESQYRGTLGSVQACIGIALLIDFSFFAYLCFFFFFPK